MGERLVIADPDGDLGVLRGEFLEGVLQPRRARPQQDHLPATLQQRRQRLEQHVVALLLGQPRDHHGVGAHVDHLGNEGKIVATEAVGRLPLIAVFVEAPNLDVVAKATVVRLVAPDDRRQLGDQDEDSQRCDDVGTMGGAPTFQSAVIAGCRDTGNLGRGYNDDTFFAGDLAEVIVYERALSDEERLLVEDYLRHKYNAGFATTVSPPHDTDADPAELRNPSVESGPGHNE